MHDPHVVAPHGGVGGWQPGDAPMQSGALAQPLVVAGLLGQVREEVPQVGEGMAEPPGSEVKPSMAYLIASVTS
ncbi:hypothetical protein GCM10010271_69930 [Streptomyces kurssanovii]|nr:hypothetical protein GCM10010271_69930 [Streptomyces kurssanovii]